MTLFFPKKILGRQEKEEDDEKAEGSGAALAPRAPCPPRAVPPAAAPPHLLCFQAFRTSFSLLFLMLATEKTKMYL